LKLTFEEPLSKFAFSFNLRPYTLVKDVTGLLAQGVSWLARLESSLPTASTNMQAVLGPRVRLLSNGQGGY